MDGYALVVGLARRPCLSVPINFCDLMVSHVVQ